MPSRARSSPGVGGACAADTSSLREIDNTSTRRLTNMSKSNYHPARSAADAVRWLRDNNHRFQAEVYEPLLLHVRLCSRCCAQSSMDSIGHGQ